MTKQEKARELGAEHAQSSEHDASMSDSKEAEEEGEAEMEEGEAEIEEQEEGGKGNKEAEE